MLLWVGGAYERLVKINKCHVSNEMNGYKKFVESKIIQIIVLSVKITGFDWLLRGR